MSSLVELLPELYFSYEQFLVFDRGMSAPGNAWTSGHYDQGFCRRSSTAAFRTLFEHGRAPVHWLEDAFPTKSLPKYSRVTAVPFNVETGTVYIEGPEERKNRQVH